MIVGMMKLEEKPLPNDREGLEKLLEELYERPQNPKRGYPDFGRSDPGKDRIEQVISKIEQVKGELAKIATRKEWIWRIITFLVGIAVGLIPKVIDWLSK